MIGRIGDVSHHLRSFFGVIKLIIFVCIHMKSRIIYSSNQGDSTIQVGGLTYLHVWESVTNYFHGIKVWNNSHSSPSPLLHLWKILHKLQTTLFDWTNLFSPFSTFLHLPAQTSSHTNHMFIHLLREVIIERKSFQITHIYLSWYGHPREVQVALKLQQSIQCANIYMRHRIEQRVTNKDFKV